MTLAEWGPYEFANGSEFVDTLAYTLKDVKVLYQFGYQQADISWVGKERNVHNWCILENGCAVGWNENPSRGWSFPVIKLSKCALEKFSRK